MRGADDLEGAWDLYDEHKSDLSGSGKLKGVKSIKDLDAATGGGVQKDDKSVDVPSDQVVKLGHGDPTHVRDGTW